MEDSRVKFRLYSDLHYEMYPTLADVPKIAQVKHGKAADIIVIAGDLHPCANERRYMEALRMVFGNGSQYILYIPGNHEYYWIGAGLNQQEMNETNIDQMDLKMAKLCQEVGGDRFVFLNGRTFDANNVRFIGATLWTDVPQDVNQGPLNDYHVIPGRLKKTLTTQEVYLRHKNQKEWISSTLDTAVDQGVRNVVMVSHHIPSERLSDNCWSYKTQRNVVAACDTLVRDTKGEYMPYYYASDMEEEISKPIISTWCFGHDHRSRIDQPFPLGPYFHSNALGYPGQYDPKFNKNLLLAI